MSSEFIDPTLDPLPSNPAPGPHEETWKTHQSGDAEGAFPDMDADADIDRISVLESMCMRCHESGVTRLLLTRIPYFRDVVVMSFECGSCHARSAEVQPANELAPMAVRATLNVNIEDKAATRRDLNRQAIKSETCSIKIPELDFEIPPNEKRGDINTVEGILMNVADSLQAGQPNRELADPDIAAKIQSVIDRVRRFASGEESFTFVLEDLAGNSFLENPHAPNPDPRVNIKHFERTREQTESMGFAVEENKQEMEKRKVIRGEEAKAMLDKLIASREGKEGEAASSSSGSSHAEQLSQKGVTVDPSRLSSLDTYFNVTDRSAVLAGQCPACSVECETRMCVTEVPHFKDVVLLVTDCEQCGYKDAEVKPMGQVSAKGLRITLKVTSQDDLKRDLLKSDTAGVSIPELDLELMSGTLGGKYTTVEGLLGDIETQLTKFNPFALGDSSDQQQRQQMSAFLTKLKSLSEVKEPFTLILDDPLGNVFIFAPNGPDNDPQMKVERYERSWQQNEDLGLNDINVDHYMTAEQEAELKAELEREKQEQNKSNDDTGSKLSEEERARLQKEIEAERKRQRELELKKSKIGGLISVDHREFEEADEEEAGNNKQGTATATSSTAAPSSPSTQ